MEKQIKFTYELGCSTSTMRSCVGSSPKSRHNSPISSRTSVRGSLFADGSATRLKCFEPGLLKLVKSGSGFIALAKMPPTSSYAWHSPGIGTVAILVNASFRQASRCFWSACMRSTTDMPPDGPSSMPFAPSSILYRNERVSRMRCCQKRQTYVERHALAPILPEKGCREPTMEQRTNVLQSIAANMLRTISGGTTDSMLNGSGQPLQNKSSGTLQFIQALRGRSISGRRAKDSQRGVCPVVRVDQWRMHSLRNNDLQRSSVSKDKQRTGGREQAEMKKKNKRK